MFARRTAWELQPNRLSLALDQHRHSGRELLDLTASNPTRCGLQYDSQAILHALADPGALDYAPEPKGMGRARQAVAAYYASQHVEVDPEQVVLTTSTSEAYSFVFRLLCDPDDEILIPTPSYPLFEYLAGLQDVRLRPYTLFYDHGWHVDWHALEEAIGPRTRAVMVVHPNNPTGSYLRPEDMDRLADLCAERGIAIVADEVFLDYAHDARPRPSFASSRKALTFTLSGISKISGLPQMKLAWIVVSGPEPMANAAMVRLEVIADTYLSMNWPIQLAAPVLIEQRHAIRDQLMARIAANLTELDRQLSAHPACRRLEVEGGWYAVLRVPVTCPDEQLAISLLEKCSVLVQPGYFYDFPGDGYLVLSLITPESEFAEGLRRVLEFIG
jgi:aspartate/methionine/tyrosine aminotransferase